MWRGSKGGAWKIKGKPENHRSPPICTSQLGLQCQAFERERLIFTRSRATDSERLQWIQGDQFHYWIQVQNPFRPKTLGWVAPAARVKLVGENCMPHAPTGPWKDLQELKQPARGSCNSAHQEGCALPRGPFHPGREGTTACLLPGTRWQSGRGAIYKHSI